MPAKKKDNMELWNKYCETNPNITKRVQTRGGFTAIDAQAQLQQATELFGPFGIAWGLDNLTYTVIADGKDSPIGISLQADFYYSFNDKSGRFPLASDMVYKANDDCFKKLRTDCITKALSQLGFAADVFLGKFDDNKYVAEMNKKYDTPKTEPKAKEPTKIIQSKPNAVSSAILMKVAEAYIDKCPKDYMVDIILLEKAVLDKYGKLPTKESSIAKILAEINVEDIIVENSFVRGLE